MIHLQKYDNTIKFDKVLAPSFTSLPLPHFPLLPLSLSLSLYLARQRRRSQPAPGPPLPLPPAPLPSLPDSAEGRGVDDGMAGGGMAVAVVWLPPRSGGGEGRRWRCNSSPFSLPLPPPPRSGGREEHLRRQCGSPPSPSQNPNRLCSRAQDLVGGRGVGGGVARGVATVRLLSPPSPSPSPS